MKKIDKSVFVFVLLFIIWMSIYVVSYFVKGSFYDFMQNANIWILLGLFVSISLILSHKKSS